jgi:plastocyanin
LSSVVTRRLVVTLVAAGAVVGLAAPSLGDTTRIKAIRRDGKYLWNKDFVTISKGDKVVWKNPTNVNHTVTFYKGASKNTTISEGERTSKKFRKRGAFLYRCTIHSKLNDGDCSGMCGHVHVN